MALEPVAARRRRVALAGHGDDVSVVRPALADTDAFIRSLALGALARLGTLEDTDLVDALADPDAAVRVRAAELAARRPGVSLLGSLDDPDPLVQEQAAWASGERDPAEPGAVAALGHLAGEASDPLVREAAVAALGAVGDVDGLPAILAATTDRPAVRRRAVLALAPFEGPEVDAALERARSDKDRQVRQAAEDLSG